MFYSPSTNGFYTPEIHGSNVPEDAVEITIGQHRALLEGQSQGKRIQAGADGTPVLVDPPPPTQEQLIAGYVAAVQQYLDDFARTRNYDGILSAATYATSTLPKFAAEGQYAVQMRDAVWTQCYALLALVEAGTREAPTIEGLIAELPELTWPN